jgi:hypothetical protein
MAIFFPQVGDQKALSDFLGSGENWTIKLFSSNTTPAASDVASTYTEASFTGYASKTMTRTLTSGTWSTPTTATPSVSNYNAGTGLTWNSTSAQTVYGYYVVGATSGTLIYSERFGNPISLVNPSSLTVYPQVSFT